jgi:hypothetical protein
MAGKTKTGIGTLGRIPGLGGNAAQPPRGIPEPPPIVASLTHPRTGMRKPTLFPKGPKLYGLGGKRQFAGGPGVPPGDFVTATTSAVEWILYWASFKLLAPNLDPRTPPYTGIPGVFEYQVSTDPIQPRSLGAAVDDFLYYLGTGIVRVRLDTWYFHIAADATQVAKDAKAKLDSARNGARTVTIYDTQIVGDPSGQAAVATLAQALSGIESLSPTTSGLGYAVRNQVTEVV